MTTRQWRFLLYILLLEAALLCSKSVPVQAVETATLHRTKPSSASHPLYQRFTITCSVEPLFLCRSCFDDLVRQQETVWKEIMQHFPRAAKLASTQKIANALYISIPASSSSEIKSKLHRIHGVIQISPSEDMEILEQGILSGTVSRSLWKDNDDDGDDEEQSEDCANYPTGKGIRVAILDSGVDYTHRVFGGGGPNDYLKAYGTNGRKSPENKNRDDGLFPTKRVVEGYDFLGDEFLLVDEDGNATEQTWMKQVKPDDDPIDAGGHGTAVANILVKHAKDVEVVAVKVCDGARCPDFALLQGIEFAVEKNCSVINVSLGRPSTSGYYSVIGAALDKAFQLGVLPVVAVGNNGNMPFVAGGLNIGPNVLSVAATIAHRKNTVPVVASYSSRGPGENNAIKPDVAAPGGRYHLATPGSNKAVSVSGTSFASPRAAAAAAKLFQACPTCSPFAVKALLMNYASERVRYDSVDQMSVRAPVSLVGAGVLRVPQSVSATFWAYCVEDAQPSISLGLINADADKRIRRTIRVVGLRNTTQEFSVSLAFREKSDSDSGVLRVISRPNVKTQNGCTGNLDVVLDFVITASKAPTNTMSSGGRNGVDPSLLDKNEVDGWIFLIEVDTNRTVTVPFHMIVRKAANVKVSDTRIPTNTFNKLPQSLSVELANEGQGIAQIDAYQLLYVDPDDPEPDRGEVGPPPDLRYVGYRLIPIENDSACSMILEFAICLWEQKQTLQNGFLVVSFDVSRAGKAEWALVGVAGNPYGTPYAECRLFNERTDEIFCTGFSPDHATNTGNVVLRMCADDLGANESGIIDLAVSSLTAKKRSPVTSATSISIKKAALSAPSFDVNPGQSIESIDLSGTGRTPDGSHPLGLLLLTNAYRDSGNTGAATSETEAIVLVRENVTVHKEVTDDVLPFPKVEDYSGPSCGWNVSVNAEVCGAADQRRLERITDYGKDSSAFIHPMVAQASLAVPNTTCFEQAIPRQTPMGSGRSSSAAVVGFAWPLMAVMALGCFRLQRELLNS